jgi:hypothetical protein
MARQPCGHSSLAMRLEYRPRVTMSARARSAVPAGAASSRARTEATKKSRAPHRCGARRGERRGFLKPGRMLRSSPHLPSSPALGAWRQYRLSNPLGGLVGSKNKSLRPPTLARCDKGKLRTSTEPVNATLAPQLPDPDRARDASRVGGGDVLLLRARMVPRISHPGNLPAAVGDHRSPDERRATATEVGRGRPRRRHGPAGAGRDVTRRGRQRSAVSHWR